MRFLNVTGSPSTNAMFGIEAPRGSDALVRQSLDCLLGIAPRDAGLGVLSGRSLSITSPRAEAPDFAKPTSRLAFWRHLPQHEGRHSFSDGGLGYSVRPLRGRKKTSKLQAGASAPVSDDSKSAPSPEGRGEPSGLKMIRITSFAEKSDPASRFFRAKQKLTPLHPGSPGCGIPFCFAARC